MSHTDKREGGGREGGTEGRREGGRSKGRPLKTRSDKIRNKTIDSTAACNKLNTVDGYNFPDDSEGQYCLCIYVK